MLLGCARPSRYSKTIFTSSSHIDINSRNLWTYSFIRRTLSRANVYIDAETIHNNIDFRSNLVEAKHLAFLANLLCFCWVFRSQAVCWNILRTDGQDLPIVLLDCIRAAGQKSDKDGVYLPEEQET